MSEPRKIVIIAGPNGAGKTTFARGFLPNDANCPVFVNADLIAAGIAPFRPEDVAFRAGRLMLEEIARVAMRVRQGGHDVPSETIRRRFASGLENLYRIYRFRVNYWQIFDNGGESPLLLEEGDNP